MGGIKEGGIAEEIHINRQSTFCLYQPAIFAHLPIAFGAAIDRWPDGHHQLDTQRVQLGDHCVRVRPVARVERPVALIRPVEEIDNDHRDG
ncbi:hypothetical protein D3C73_1203460 [compost metagenome]